MATDVQTDVVNPDDVHLRGSSGIAVLGRQIVVHGKDLHRECMDMSFLAYTFFSATGRELPPAQARVMEEFWIATGYADPRIWCNRIAGYLGSARVDPALSLSAGIAASDSAGYGFGAMRAAYALQKALPQELAERERWLNDWLASRQLIPGYGRPIYGRDERIPVALRSMARWGLSAGPALRRAFWLDERLRTQKGIAMNISGLWAATAVDFGLTAAEYAEFMLMLLAPGYMATYADQRRRPAFSFLPDQQSERG